MKPSTRTGQESQKVKINPSIPLINENHYAQTAEAAARVSGEERGHRHGGQKSTSQNHKYKQSKPVAFTKEKRTEELIKLTFSFTFKAAILKED